jgi:hypothetical protein
MLAYATGHVSFAIGVLVVLMVTATGFAIRAEWPYFKNDYYVPPDVANQPLPPGAPMDCPVCDAETAYNGVYVYCCDGDYCGWKLHPEDAKYLADQATTPLPQCDLRVDVSDSKRAITLEE